MTQGKKIQCTTRPENILGYKSCFEHLYTLKDFPVFMGCVETPPEEDQIADMIWDICPETGIIQLKELVPLDILYQNQHNDGTGQTWQNHYVEFAKFVKKHNPGNNVLEIGGAHDWIAKHYMKMCPDVHWIIVEPNPTYVKGKKIKIVKSFFDENFTIDDPVDTVIHSHVFEHAFNPLKFIEHISRFLKEGDRQVFACPNMIPMLKRYYTNCINFEHTVWLPEIIVDYILQKSGFDILEKKYFGEAHSIFYATEKKNIDGPGPTLENRYDEHKEIFMGFVNYHLDMVQDLNQKIKAAKDPVYLFGGHIFSLYLIQFGLKTNEIVGILDNSPIKQGKRLYGTSLMVESPKVLKDKGRVNMILKAGDYNKEIKDDIIDNINNEVEIW